MITSQELFETLSHLDLAFFTGVPDSGLREFLLYLEKHEAEAKHIRAVNEGQAVALAAGYHLATGKIPLVYMQNSGLGNAVNPLTSLADPAVYGIPMVVLVAWRGRPGEKDEPQHEKMGKITQELLQTLGIPHEVAKESREDIARQLKQLKANAQELKSPVALIFPKGIIAKEGEREEHQGMKREEALELLLEKIGESPVVCTTGYTSREVFEIREKREQSHERDFLCVGSMGHASSIALGIASSTTKRVYLLDGEGALLMHLGAAPTIGFYAPKNLLHIVIDNGVYESTGSQPTISGVLDWQKFFEAVGYKSIALAGTREELEQVDLSRLQGPAVLVVRVIPGTRSNLRRPTTSPRENKEGFMRFLQDTNS